VLDPADPVSMGAMVGPDAYTEVRYLAHAKHQQALQRIPEVAAAFAASFGRDSGGLIRPYRHEDAETLVLVMGSVLGTLEDAIDELRDEGAAVGAVGITSFRPFPAAALRAATSGARRLVVLERALGVGGEGIVTADLCAALRGSPIPVHTVVAGLGGRPITKTSLRALLADVATGTLEPLRFLDLDTDLVTRELRRMDAGRRSGPSAENLLRDLDLDRARGTAATT